MSRYRKPRKQTPFKQDGMTLIELFDRFSNDDQAREYLEQIRWNGTIVCPHCANVDQAKFSTIKANPIKKVRAGLRYCSACKKQFTVTVGTVFEDSHIPLRKWVIAWHLLCASKKGISSLQLQRMLKLGSYRTALFMAHRIRFALKDPIFNEPLQGIVETDETFVGGKQEGVGSGSKDNKTPVVSLVERGGNKRSFVVERVTAKNLIRVVRENVQICSDVYTDELPAYTGLTPKFEHHPVKHSAKEYVRREGERVIHTNTVESSFSLLKRGIVGAFHHVSKKHLPLYVAEFDHRWNTRHDSDGERTEAGIRKTVGKRLTYKPLTKKKK